MSCTCDFCRAPKTALHNDDDLYIVTLPALIRLRSSHTTAVLAVFMNRFQNTGDTFCLPKSKPLSTIFGVRDLTKRAMHTLSNGGSVRMRSNPWRHWLVNVRGVGLMRCDRVKFVTKCANYIMSPSRAVKTLENIDCTVAAPLPVAFDVRHMEAARVDKSNDTENAIDKTLPPKKRQKMVTNNIKESAKMQLIRKTPANKWTRQFLFKLLADVHDVPDMRSIHFLDRRTARCEFVHPDGQIIIADDFPIAAVYYVPKYKSIMPLLS